MIYILSIIFNEILTPANDKKQELGMSVKDFHKFLTSDEQLHSFGTCVQTVDILSLHGGTGGAVGNGDHRRLAKQYVQQRSALVVDGENCLDRLYGGYFSGEHFH